MANITEEAHEMSNYFADDTNENTGRPFSLPPTDGGKAAWLFLVASFISEAVVWGFPYSFGVFESYYSQQVFPENTGGIAAIGTTATGIMYLLSPVLLPVLQRWHRARRPFLWIGLVIMASSLIAASYCSTVIELVMTQGVLYAIGGAIFYSPILLFLDEWFIRRKGLAFGVMWAGTGVAGVVIPFVTRALLDKYGFRTTLRTWGIATFIVTVPCLFFIKARLPGAATSGQRRTDYHFIKSSAFWFFAIGNMSLNLGFSLPTIYMPSYATAVGFSTLSGVIGIALFNALGAIGGVIAGILVDKYHVTTVTLMCGIGSAVSVLLFWCFAVSESMLYVFAILYGLFAGSFTSTWSRSAGAIRIGGRNAETSSVLAFLIGGKGVGSIISGPLSQKLIQAPPFRSAIGAYSTNFGALVIFCGITSFFGASSFGGRLFGFV